ncbi:hypothetical protein [Streptomyces sp. NPDC058398]|uniref:hypothetical protein n=1 Tax=Streptomyces sp. NPDC058398 TaxID=3346479 RepID=UPI003664601E
MLEFLDAGNAGQHKKFPILHNKGMQRMLFSHRTAAVAAFAGSVAAICLGATQAHAGVKPDDCSTAREGVVCVQKNDTYTDKDGTHVIKQDQQCTMADRPNVATQQDQLVGSEPTKVGPVVECSNTAELPKGFKKPHFGS